LISVLTAVPSSNATANRRVGAATSGLVADIRMPIPQYRGIVRRRTACRRNRRRAIVVLKSFGSTGR